MHPPPLLPLPEELTVSAMVVVLVMLPDTPVMVMVDEPVAAELEAAIVAVLVPVVGLVAKVTVTPLGSPEALSVTAPVNPSTSSTEMVSVVLDP